MKRSIVVAVVMVLFSFMAINTSAAPRWGTPEIQDNKVVSLTVEDIDGHGFDNATMTVLSPFDDGKTVATGKLAYIQKDDIRISRMSDQVNITVIVKDVRSASYTLTATVTSKGKSFSHPYIVVRDDKGVLKLK